MNPVALTVDLEPDWGRGGTEAFHRVTPRFLDLLDERGARATFFVASDLLDEDDGMVAALAKQHEVASHGCSHVLLPRVDARRACRELEESRTRLEQATGRAVAGFRAPFFARAGGHLERVRAAGYQYDASVGSVWPGPHNRRLGKLDCPYESNGIAVFPTSAMAHGLLPLSLTWLRVIPRRLWGAPRGRPQVFYLHLHEFLPAETAHEVPWHVRKVITRRCGNRHGTYSDELWTG